jgi:sugar O-acyltransferase (sialic acid O-acetyltransferase NeuD family)
MSDGERAEGLDLVIIGAGGHGTEVLSYIGDLGREGARIRVRGFVDEGKAAGRWKGSEILGGFAELEAFLEYEGGQAVRYITAIGDNRAREACVCKIGRLKPRPPEPWTLRHPRSIAGADVCVGPGTCLAPGSIFTTNVHIGSHCIVNVGASISHDTELGDYVNVNPGAVVAGNVRIGAGCYIGAGATIIDRVTIGEWSTVGAGAVVVEDLPPFVTAVGVPAKVIKRHR